MILYYFKIAWRNLTKHKLFSFINIFGLASGMTVCMLALIKIKDAYDYDTFHPHSNRTYRIITNLIRKNEEERLYASSPIPLGSYLKNNYKAIDKCSRVYFSFEEVTANDKKLSAKEAYVDPDFYDIFGFKLISGSTATGPQTVLLTPQTAERFFGKENPIGQTITIGNSVHFLVTGILEKPPFPSHLKFDLLASMSSLSLLQDGKLASGWTDESAAYTYVQLKANASSGMLKDVLKNVTKQVNIILPPDSEKNFEFDVQPLNKISPAKPLHP